MDDLACMGFDGDGSMLASIFSALAVVAVKFSQSVPH